VAQTRAEGAAGEGRPAERRPAERRERLPGRVALYYRQVLAELRKVIWPTQQELVTYTGVVLAFVVVMIALVVVLDILFGQAALWVFG